MRAAGALPGWSTGTSACEAPAATKAWAAGSENRSAHRALRAGPGAAAVVSNRPSRRARRAKASPGPGAPTGPSIWARNAVPTSRHHRYSAVHAGPSVVGPARQPGGGALGVAVTHRHLVGRHRRGHRGGEVRPLDTCVEAELAQHRRAVQEPVEGGVGVVDVAGHGELGAVDRATRHRRSLQDGHPPPGPCQQGRGHEAVGPRPDHHCVDVVHRRPA